jgi:hypothetical protein
LASSWCAKEGIEVQIATFRSDHAYRDGRRPEAVTFETDPRQDVLRRDFTINALLEDPFTGEVIDHVHGLADLRARCLRAIGDPAQRFTEDRLRLLRAIRFAARLGFTIEPATWDASSASPPPSPPSPPSASAMNSRASSPKAAPAAALNSSTPRACSTSCCPKWPA